MNEIERLKAELAAVEREDADAKAAMAAIKAGKKPAKIRRAPKPAKNKPAKPAVHRNSFKGSIEGYGGPAPVGSSTRTNNTPVVTRHIDAIKENVEYEGRECLMIAAAEAGSNMNGIICRCADCSAQ
jgi:anti-sigma factor RsiW